jgi:hypothetical protein
VHGVGRSWTSHAEQGRRFQEGKLVYLQKIGAPRVQLSLARLFGAAGVIMRKRG